MSMHFTNELVEKGDIVNRYLQEQLSPEENIAFEDYLMEHPELLERLQLDEVYIDSIGSVDLSLNEDAKQPKLFSPWPSIKWVGLGAIGAYASVVLFSLLGTTATMMNIDRVVYVETVRSSDPVQKRIKLGDKNEKMVLMLSAPFDQQGPFDVTILRVDTEEVVAEFNAVTKTETEDIAVVVDTRLFKMGVYRFSSIDTGMQNEKSIHIEFF